MRVSVISIQGNRVRLQTKVGCITVLWGTDQYPRIKDYEVELFSDDTVSQSSVNCSSNNHISVTDSVYGVEITGYLECITDDVMFLNLCDDVIMLDVDCKAYLLSYIGHYITVKLTNITAFDCGYI